MSIKRILVPLTGSFEHTTNHSAEIDMALAAAKTLGAHVEALFISPPPPLTRGGVSVGTVGYSGPNATAAAVRPINWFAEERDRIARDAHKMFTRACATAGITVLSPNDQPGTPLAAAWREIEGSYALLAAQRAASFDLIIAGSATMLEQLKEIAELSLLQTRRPVLLAH